MSGFPGSHAGRVAVVTGAASGLGREYAVRLAQDGADVVVADVADGEGTVRQIHDAGGSVLAVRCDVTQPDDVASLAEVVRSERGRCDILVNNAGISPHVAWDDLDYQQWRTVLTVNLDSMFLLSKAFVPGMRERGFGRVINISSNTFGLVIDGFAHYMASKGGVIGLTRAMATELGDDGITVNAILPGLTRTPTTQEMWRGTSLFEDMAQRQAVKRPGEPADLAGVVSFLATEDARWVTGQSLVVDGGLVRL